MKAAKETLEDQLTGLEAEKQEIERREKSASVGLDNTTQLVYEYKTKMGALAERLQAAETVIADYASLKMTHAEELQTAERAAHDAQMAQRTAEDNFKAAKEAHDADKLDWLAKLSSMTSLVERAQIEVQEAQSAHRDIEAAFALAKESHETTQKKQATEERDKAVEAAARKPSELRNSSSSDPDKHSSTTEKNGARATLDEKKISLAHPKDPKIVHRYGHQSRPAMNGGPKTRFTLPRTASNRHHDRDEESQNTSATFHTAKSSQSCSLSQTPATLERTNSMRRSRSQWFSTQHLQDNNNEEEEDAMISSESISSSLSELATNDDV